MTDPQIFLILFGLVCVFMLALSYILAQLKGEIVGIYICADCGEVSFGGKGGSMLCEECIRKEVGS